MHDHHEHHHHEPPANYNRAFLIGIGLNVAVAGIEIIYGLRSHSLALISDAGHNATDVLGLVLAGTASALSRRKPSRRRTYGLRRSSILASLFNAVFLFVIVGAIGWEAIKRFNNPVPINSQTMILVASIGLILNALAALLFRDRKHDINVRAAYMHLASDALNSFGVIVGGVVIYFTNWFWLDPIISIGLSMFIAYTTWGIIVEAFNLAVDAVPQGVDLPAVEQYLSAVPGISEVHDLHIWGMSTTETALTVHLVTESRDSDNILLNSITEGLHDRFGIEHSTIQMELLDADHECVLRDPLHV